MRRHCIQRTCEQCGQEYRPRRLSKNIRFCSVSCRRLFEKPKPRPCLQCERIFEPDEDCRKFCSQSCSARFSNLSRLRSRSSPKTEKFQFCLECNNSLSSVQIKFCSQTCQQKNRYDVFIFKWKTGIEPGFTHLGKLSGFIRRYLIATRGARCEQCGWAKANPHTGKVPVNIDHIDGRWNNASESNLRILCPNCHALTPTFGVLNKGKGHPWRRKWYQTAATDCG